MKIRICLRGTALFMCLIIWSSGSVAQWEHDGVPVCTATDHQEHIHIVPDGAGGAIIAWDDDRDYQDIYAQRINNLGEVLWAADGLIICGAASPNLTDVVSDGSGGAFLVWDDYRNFSTRDVYAQHIDMNGAAHWTADGVYLGPEGVAARIAWNGAKGAIAVWEDERNYGATLTDIYANGVDSLENVWADGGISICTEGGIQQDPHIATDGEGGAVMAWVDYRGTYPNNHSIFVQRVTREGVARWASGGMAVANLLSTDVLEPYVVTDGKGGAIVAWQDNRSFRDIYAQRIDAAGNIKWAANGVAICGAAEWQGNLSSIPDGEGGAIITWWDNRDGNGDIYAQRVDSLGNTLWTADGVPVCNDPGEQYKPPVIASDGAGGAIICWNDQRGADTDIYLQRIDAEGSPMWTANGVMVCGASGWQYEPVIAPDGAHGAVVAWEDMSGADRDIYVNSVNFSGIEKVATLLASSSVRAGGDGITVSWTMSDIDNGVIFHISRSESEKGFYEDVGIITAGEADLSFEYTDRECENGVTYCYRVDTEVNGHRVTLFETIPVRMPFLSARLDQNIPNPFNPSTVISYYLPEGSFASIRIFDTSGRLVRTLMSGYQEAGESEVLWDGRNLEGCLVRSGIYYCRLDTGKYKLSRKMVLLR